MGNSEELYSTNGETIEVEQKKGKNSQRQEIERWLNSAYTFRVNWIKQKPEYREKATKDPKFHPIDKYKLLSIKRQLDTAGFNISKDGLMDILFSDFSPKVNPVKDYFENLFPWNEEDDYIEELATTVKCKNSDQWMPYLKKWLVGVVANVFIDERCANHTMLVLTGGQGKFKTTWLENLCPKNLINYLYTGKLNLESKDSLTLIAENLFINIDDQLKQLHKKDENELKNLITINYVKYRRPYDPIITEYPHLCSFMGSVNGNEFLNDPTGSRRFLPFEVENIDIKAAQGLDMDLVWAQAYNLFINKYRYWFNDEEIDELNNRNSEFAMTSIEEQLVQFYYSNKVSEGAYGVLKYIPPAIILSRLETLSKLRLSPKKLGDALSKFNFNKLQKGSPPNRQWVWEVYEKSDEQIAIQQQS
ncbi:MAG: putative P-loop ATPase [Bacteroidota bacterium]|jgi:predicted P-loop ATPase|nr:putative P-loop ATPase [Bacteroidota bacterium]